MVPLREEDYSERGELIRTIILSDIRRLSGRIVPSKMECQLKNILEGIRQHRYHFVFVTHGSKQLLAFRFPRGEPAGDGLFFLQRPGRVLAKSRPLRAQLGCFKVKPGGLFDFAFHAPLMPSVSA